MGLFIILALFFSYSSIAKPPYFLPEYEGLNKAIVFTLVDSKFQSILEERISAITKSIRDNPQQNFILYVGKPENGNEMISVSWAKEKFKGFKNLKIIEANEPTPYEWSRDWIPRRLEDGRYVTFYGGSNSDSHIIASIECIQNQDIQIEKPLEILAKDIDSIANYLIENDNFENLEGGDLIVSDNGRCFTAGDELDSSKVIVGCSEVHNLPELPGEITGHIDIFAQFVSSDTVVIGQYLNNDVREINLIHHNYYNCDHTLEDCEIKEVANEKEPKYEVNSKEKTSKQSEHNWVKHSQDVITYFQSKGYKVEVIENPTPARYTIINHYFDSSGKERKTTKENRYIFPSYINSILMQDSVIVPVYSKYESPIQREKAVSVYHRYKKKVTEVELSNHAILNGGIHCLSSNIPEVGAKKK